MVSRSPIRCEMRHESRGRKVSAIRIGRAGGQAAAQQSRRPVKPNALESKKTGIFHHRARAIGLFWRVKAGYRRLQSDRNLSEAKLTKGCFVQVPR